VFADKYLVYQKKETWLTHLFSAMGVPGDVRVSGVRCQEKETEKLKPATSAFVIWNFYSSSTPKQLAIFTGDPTKGGTLRRA
jgi:hypothetical protein